MTLVIFFLQVSLIVTAKCLVNWVFRFKRIRFKYIFKMAAVTAIFGFLSKQLRLF